MATRKKPNNDVDIEMDKDFIKQQIDQAVKTFLAQFAILVQVLTILAVANVTIIGYAINEKFSGALFIGGFIPLSMMYVLYGGSKFMVPIIYSAAMLENKLGAENKSLLISTFVGYMVSPEYLSQLTKIDEIKDDEERISSLHNIGFPIFRRRRFNAILIFSSIVQFTSPFLMSYYFGWKLF